MIRNIVLALVAGAALIAAAALRAISSQGMARTCRGGYQRKFLDRYAFVLVMYHHPHNFH